MLLPSLDRWVDLQWFDVVIFAWQLALPTIDNDSQRFDVVIFVWQLTVTMICSSNLCIILLLFVWQFTLVTDDNDWRWFVPVIFVLQLTMLTIDYDWQWFDVTIFVLSCVCVTVDSTDSSTVTVWRHLVVTEILMLWQTVHGQFDRRKLFYWRNWLYVVFSETDDMSFWQKLFYRVDRKTKPKYYCRDFVKVGRQWTKLLQYYSG